MSEHGKSLGFEPIALTEAECALVTEVRAFARAAPFPPSAESPTRGGFSRTYSEELANRGWVGMTIPAEYGGSARSGVERCLVISELLAAGAPLGAHWTADRQTAPSLMINGPETLRRELLPRIAAGRCLIAGGFSEPESGSDLASVRTRARKVDGGWRITGRKIWTTDADKADYIEILCRTSDSETKHQGLSLIVVPMGAEGLSVHPIEGMDGERHFNEVVIDDVFARDDCLIGKEGSGWEQLTAELALERAGPERYLSTFPLFEAFVRSRRHVSAPERSHELIGSVIAQQIGLRLMSLSIARMVDNGGSPVAEAAMAKDLGTELEQLLVDQLWGYRYEPIEPGAVAERFHEFLDINRLRSPVFTTAGGTNEVLRLLVSRQLGSWARSGRTRALGTPLAETVFEQASRIVAEPDPDLRSVPRNQADGVSVRVLGELREAGYLGVSVPEEFGGSGGTLADALEILRGAAYAGVSTPLIEGPIQAGWLLTQAGIGFPWTDELAVASTGSIRLDDAGATLTGTLDEIRWPEQATTVAVPVERDGRLHVATLALADFGRLTTGANTAGEPVARAVCLDRIPVRRLEPTELDFAAGQETLARRGALARAVALSRALQRTAEIAIEYAAQRSQFGQPINRFQAVQAHLARLASEAQRVAVLVDAAHAALGKDGDPALDSALVAAACILCGDAAMVASRTAHQVHGAIGVTMEYVLQRFTRRLWEWAAADSTSAHWARRLGAQAVSGDLAAWELITGI
ncbi:acyl-CoA dehydrogenase family protein [Streptomyces sp. NPDC056653]|uniref:acyl-CoA dehydrogenase family protein n=1 Tax=Streptomyces sp. NPDC056653 TaxID=3345894 RepID=UPI0036BA8A50